LEVSVARSGEKKRKEKEKSPDSYIWFSLFSQKQKG
jgi:hypothetical protein